MIQRFCHLTFVAVKNHFCHLQSLEWRFVTCSALSRRNSLKSVLASFLGPAREPVTYAADLLFDIKPLKEYISDRFGQDRVTPPVMSNSLASLRRSHPSCQGFVRVFIAFSPWIHPEESMAFTQWIWGSREGPSK